MVSEVLLSIREVAKRQHLNYETVRRWLKAGKLRGYQIGKQWRVKESDIILFCKPNKVP